MNQVAKLKAIFKSLKMECLPGIHDEQTAAVAEQDGFKGVWMSVAEQAQSCTNELCWLNILERAGTVSGTLNIPCLLDIGKGFGDLKNTVDHLHRLGVAGVCLEDDVEPAQPWTLAAVNESCNQLRAARAAVGHDIFLVARCSTLASGRGMQETLDRCYALQKAGIDAVLLHSEKAHGLEIAEFMYRWRGAVPVAIISSEYTSVLSQVFDNAGVAVAIRTSCGLSSTQTDPEQAGWLHVEAHREDNVNQGIPPLDTMLLRMAQEDAENRYQAG